METRPLLISCMFALAAVVAASGGCGGSGGVGFGGGAGSGDDSGVGFTNNTADGGGGGAACVPGSGSLACQVPQGCTTSLSGTVFDPAGRNPLYNVAVFVPNDPNGKLPAITPGTHSCNTCDVPIGNYVAVTTTDAKGHFTLTGVPAGMHIPLVVQTGKWRREVFLGSVTACQDNPVPAASSRLPKSRKDGDVADLPQMLLLTGGCDDLGCFMKSMGIDDSEFSPPKGGGRLDVYQGSGLIGSGASMSSGQAGTWGSPVFNKAAYEYYDLAIFSCECAEHQESAAGRQALHDWLGEGGKVFASHYHYTWFSAGPADFQGVANWLGGSVAAGSGNYTVDTSFPKGQVLQQWLVNVKAATGNTIALTQVASSVSTVKGATTRWIYDQASNNDVKYLSFLTPIGGLPPSGAPGEAKGPQYCGKAVFTDLHTSGSLLSAFSSIPASCTGAALTAQQQALEFLFFDLSACVAPDTLPPPPPPGSIQ